MKDPDLSDLALPPRRPSLGVTGAYGSLLSADAEGIPAVIVATTTREEILKGDAIVGLAGFRIRGEGDLGVVLNRYAPGNTVTVRLLRRERVEHIRLHRPPTYECLSVRVVLK